MPENINPYVAEYRYFTTDLVSNQILAEIPFKGVSYERAIKGAGKFQGSIPVIPNTKGMDLYNSTMPGKTGLYIMRNGEVVWGGIIWSRSYDVISRNMQVNGSEFTSYFHHRMIWKTWTHEYGATITINNNNVGTVNLDASYSFNFTAGALVRVLFYDIQMFPYNGYFRVLASPAPTSTSFSFTVPSVQTVTSSGGTVITSPVVTSIPNGTYPLGTIVVHADTYEYIRSLLDDVSTDYAGIAFPNTDIEPGIVTDYQVSNKQITSGVATLTTVSDHGLSIGQVVRVRNVDTNFNGQYIVTEVPTTKTIKYAVTGKPNVASTNVPNLVSNITYKQIDNYVATLTTSAPHGMSVGQTAIITGVDPGDSTTYILDGEYVITAVSSSTTLSYLTSSLTNVAYQASSGGTIAVTPSIRTATYGPFTDNSNLDFSYASQNAGEITYDPRVFSGVAYAPTAFRGYELKNVGDELDKFSDNLRGFEYRVDCAYDPATASFTRTFVLIAINYPNPPAAGEVSPISRFGADKLVFEWPGNIFDLSIDEKSDDAATRFWMVGNNGSLGNDAAQPYVADTQQDLLLAGWPIIDRSESSSDIYDPNALFMYAGRYLAEFRPPIADIRVEVNGSISPQIGEYAPGDWCALVVDDEFIRMRLASDLEVRNTVLVRKIDSYTVTLTDNPTFPEKVALNLVAEWQVDARG